MPLYTYECAKCHKKREEFRDMDECMRHGKCECGGKTRRLLGVRVTPSSNWPLESEACAVHPSQVTEATMDAARNGIPTEFNPRTGGVIFRSKAHRKAYCEHYGYYDRNAGYGDPTRS